MGVSILLLLWFIFLIGIIALDLENSLKQLKRRNTELEMENTNIKKLYTSCVSDCYRIHM